MTHTVEATYENGILRLAAPLPLKEQQRVRVTVQPEPSSSNTVPPRHDPTRVEPATMASALASSLDEPSDFAEYEMLDIWLNVPPSPDAITVVARLGPLPLPDPPVIPHGDDEIE